MNQVQTLVPQRGIYVGYIGYWKWTLALYLLCGYHRLLLKYSRWLLFVGVFFVMFGLGLVGNWVECESGKFDMYILARLCSCLAMVAATAMVYAFELSSRSDFLAEKRMVRCDVMVVGATC